VTRASFALAPVLLLSGCGHGHAGSITVAALGDSITAGSPGYDPDPQRGRALGFGHDARSQWEYWAARKDARLVFRNCGVFGERTDEIARRLDTCAKGADVLVVQGGINDIAQGRSRYDAESSLRAMVRKGKRLGLQVALADVLPWNNASPGVEQQIEALNASLHLLAQQERVRLLPFFATLDDPEHPGTMKQEWTAEGDHPSVAGYRRLGELAFGLPS
jgi:lysophospholipase L1-like esterase